MNKLLLLYIIIYSISSQANEYMSRGSLPACFYTEDNFQGQSICLTAPKAIDLYDPEYKYFTLPISSIKIPKGIQVTVYKNDSLKNNHYNLTESVNLALLDEISMSEQISEIKVLELPGFCGSNCVIINNQKLEIDNTFSKYTSELDDINKLVLLNFNINDKSNFIVGTIDYPQIIVIGRNLFFYTTGDHNPINMRLNGNTEHLSFLFKFNNKNLQFQYLEANDTEPLNIPFWISTQYSPKNSVNLYITNGVSDNDQGLPPENIPPLILNKTIIAINKHAHRDKRGALGIGGCIGLPWLAIYNYVVQGRCNQLDKLVGINEFSHPDGAGKTLVIAATAPPPTIEHDASTAVDDPRSSMLVLTHLNTHLYNQSLTLPAAAKACKTSVLNILSARYPRQTPSSTAYCGRWVSEVMADFVLLFGSQLSAWTTDYFRHVVTGILDTGNIELPPLNSNDRQIAVTAIERHSDVVQRLIINIQSHNITQEDTAHIIRPLTQAFNRTQMNLANYQLQNRHSHPTVSATEAQLLPLGSYELLLANFVYQETYPRVLHNGEWTTSDTGFEIEIIDDISTITSDTLNELRTVLSEWSDIYKTYRRERNEQRENTFQAGCSIASQCLTPRDETLIVGLELIDIMRTDIACLPLEPNHWVIVRHNNQIISLLVADSEDIEDNRYGSGSVEISASVSHPNYVLNPENEGTIRGASTAAFMAFAQHMKAKGKTKLYSEVITQPSAKVKLKLGFSHKKDEL